MSFFKRIFSGKKKESLDSGLEKTRSNVFQRLAKVFTGRRSVDEDLMDAANIIEGEKIQIVNNNNGERFDTYVIPGQRNSGEITVNGAAARKVQVDDVLILITYAFMSLKKAKSFNPTVVFPDEKTNLLK